MAVRCCSCEVFQQARFGACRRSAVLIRSRGRLSLRSGILNKPAVDSDRAVARLRRDRNHQDHGTRTRSTEGTHGS